MAGAFVRVARRDEEKPADVTAIEPGKIATDDRR
jgi:hypothetical protein